MKTFFTLLFFCAALFVKAQVSTYASTSKQETISTFHTYLSFGAGIICSNDGSLNDFMQANGGKAISNVSPEARQVSLCFMSRKRNIADHRLGMGFDINYDSRRSFLEIPIYLELPQGKRSSRFVSLNPGVERYAIYANPPTNLAMNENGGYYMSYGYCIGLCYHYNYFLNKDPQMALKLFSGFDAGINFQLSHSHWDYGNTRGTGKQQIFIPALENVNIPPPGNINIFIRIHFGVAN